jgi:aryl-alcohol dehydrogenase-like predicted oxidoreductase
MKRIVIPRTSLKSSRLVFGTLSLHRLAAANARSRLLSIAYDKGITHFDTARMFGDGIAERALGR